MPPKKLFKTYPIKFGYTPGCRVAHIFEDDPKGQELDFEVGEKIHSGYGEINPAENFINEGDKKNRDYFLSLANMAEALYAKYQSDKYISNTLFAIKDYITAPTHDAQHNGLKMVMLRSLEAREQFEKNLKALKKNITKNAKKIKEVEDKLNTIDNLANSLGQKIFGNLKVDDELPITPDPDKTFMGHSVPGQMLGSWQRSEKALFPHDPSPNDIKQGVGLMDCFMMAQLCNIAREDPDFIKNSMRDNADGTVSVRFFTKNNQNEYVPEYIRVNKTVNQDLFGNNYYASSSLWVQMMEKAYSEYTRRHQPVENQKGDMGNINLGKSYVFLERFTGKPAERVMSKFGVIGERFNDRDQNGKWMAKPDFYLPEEKQMFDFFKKSVNDEKSSLTCGTDTRHAFHSQEIKDKGIRPGHAYSITKLFEKDGKYFVQLRDPYAIFTPNYDKAGALTTQSDTKVLGDMISGSMNVGRENMGCFNLEIRDFMYYFGTIDGLSPEKKKEFEDMQKGFHDYSVLPLNEIEKADPEQFNSQYDARYQEYKINMQAKVEIKQALAKKIIIDRKLALGKDLSESELNNLQSYQEAIDKNAKILNMKNPILHDGEVVEADSVLENQQEPEAEQIVENKVQDANDIEIIDDQPEIVEEKKANEEYDIVDLDDNGEPLVSGNGFINKLQREAEQLTDIHNRLMGSDGKGYLEIANKIKTVYSNLDATSRFFSWQNSGKYNAMHDKIEAINKSLQSLVHPDKNDPNAEPKPMTEEQAKTIAKDLLDASNLTNEYLDYKFEQMMVKASKGKIHNERSFQRMIGAYSFVNLVSGGDVITPPVNNKYAIMNIIINDVDTHLESLNDKKASFGPTKEETLKAQQGFKTYFTKNPKVKQEYESFLKKQEADFDFEVIEDEPVADDFEIIDDLDKSNEQPQMKL